VLALWYVLQVSPKMRVEELRNVIRDEGGILPALQRLSYAGEGAGNSQPEQAIMWDFYIRLRLHAMPLAE
jgi:hypothetical protein